MQVQELIKDLQTSLDWEDRRRAARLLGKMKEPEALLALVSALEDKDEDVKQAAILAIAGFGDESAVDEILKPKIINSENPDIRWAAHFALGRLQRAGDLRIIEEMLKSADDPLWIIRNASTDVLRRQIDLLAQDSSPDNIKILLRILATSEYEIQEKVIGSLEDIGKKNVHLVIEGLLSISDNVRAGTAKILGEIGDTEVVESLMKLLGDENSKVRLFTVLALGRLKDENSIYPLIEKLNDGDKRVRKAAIDVLASFGRNATAPLINSLKYAPGKEFKKNIIKTLGKIKDPASLYNVMQALYDSFSVVRMAAIDAIVAMGDEKTVDKLIEILSVNRASIDNLLDEAQNHPFEHVRIRAIRALGELRDSRAVEVLKRILREEENLIIVEEVQNALAKIGLGSWRRRAAVTALGRIVNLKAVEPLIERLMDYNKDVRIDAARALGSLKDKRAVEPVLECLEHEDYLLRKESAVVLGIIGTGNPKVTEALIRRLKDEKAEVRAEAAKALGRLLDLKAREPLKEALNDSYWSVRRDAENALNNLDAVNQ
ncbi:MAG: HEAT repeat domain-containing protein [Firmicutes bacterium]|nr:HEAT repeat domain-containing protein [Bacillota bacterium]